jgi:hypothetical protein
VRFRTMSSRMRAEPALAESGLIYNVCLHNVWPVRIGWYANCCILSAQSERDWLELLNNTAELARDPQIAPSVSSLLADRFERSTMGS